MNTLNDSKVDPGSRWTSFLASIAALCVGLALVLLWSPMRASGAEPIENLLNGQGLSHNEGGRRLTPIINAIQSISVSISGPASGMLNSSYTFISTVSPATVTLPIPHVWRADEQAPVTLISGLTSTVAYTWTTPGVKAITVTVSDGSGSVAVAHHSIVIGASSAPTQISFFQPGAGSTGNPVWITAQVDPLTVTLPITYTWTASELPPLTLVRNSIQGGSWFGANGWSGQYTYAAFTWNSPGAKTITLTAANTDSVITATTVVSIGLAPTVVLTGATSPQMGVPYVYTATVSPVTTSLPIYYSWYSTGHPWSGVSGGLTDTSTYTWTTPGNKVVQVWVNNADGWDQDGMLIKIPAPAPLLTPTLESASSGDWNNPATWNLARTPLITDVVLIHPAHVVTTAASIEIDALVNHGTLSLGDPVNMFLEITATSFLSNSGIIKAADVMLPAAQSLLAPSAHPACNGTGGTAGTGILVAATQTYNNGLIQAGNGLNGGIGGSVIWTPSPNTTLWNDTLGVIRGGDGGNGAPGGGGGPGGDVTLSGVPFDNDGLIQAGDGGDGDQCGGAGGSTYVLAENSTNTGTIAAGDGGDTTDNLATAHGGDGGDTEVWGKFFTWSGFLVNVGTITAGDGGNGNPGATIPQDAGCGGNLTLMAAPNVFLGGGTHAAGMAGTPSAGGTTCTDGWVSIDPASISLTGDTTITGGNVAVYGGEDWTLDLRNLNSEVISATGDIVLAVGSGGVIDLSGNATRLFRADGQVRIYADEIRLDPGVPLFALAGTNVITGPAQILHNVSVVAPDVKHAEPGEVVPVHFRVLNASPVTDTFTLSQVNSAAWSVSGLPASITVDALGNQEVILNVTVPASAQHGDVNEVTFNVTSQSDPQASASAQTYIGVESQPGQGYRIYLPLVLRNF